jgi:hypothetical protein
MARLPRRCSQLNPRALETRALGVDLAACDDESNCKGEHDNSAADNSDDRNGPVGLARLGAARVFAGEKVDGAH